MRHVDHEAKIILFIQHEMKMKASSFRFQVGWHSSCYVTNPQRLDNRDGGRKYENEMLPSIERDNLSYAQKDAAKVQPAFRLCGKPAHGVGEVGKCR
jgi:hypothetical protein